MSYINFHSHSVYSKKDAISEPIDIALINKEYGNDAFCITDHGDLGAWIQAYKAEEKTGIQFIPGCEFYIKPDEQEMWIWNKANNDEIEVSENAVKYFHLVVIAKNQIGVKNLIRIYNSNEEHYGKPLITKEALFANKEGLIVTTACVSGQVMNYIMNDDLDKAENYLREYKSEFGDDYYCELQYHNLSFIDEIDCYNKLVALAKKVGVKMIPTTDSHFNKKEDVVAHNIYKDIYKERFRYDFDKGAFNEAFDGDGYYIKNEEEIRETLSHITALSQDDIDEAVNNTVEIRKKCEPTHFPKALPLSDKSQELRKLVEDGFKKKRVGTPLEQDSRKRIEYELDVIKHLGFTEYFINMYDIVNRARMLGILTGPARGCFLAGNKVTTSNGYKNIEDVIEGDKVLTRSGEFKNVQGLHEYDADEDCLEISLSNGKTIRCTPDHEILVNGEWVRADNLIVGDVLTSAEEK